MMRPGRVIRLLVLGLVFALKHKSDYISAMSSPLSKRLLLSKEDLQEGRIKFDQADMDGNGHMTAAEIGNILMSTGVSVPGYEIRELIYSIDDDRNGTIEFSEFLTLYLRTKEHNANRLETLLSKQAEVPAPADFAGTIHHITDAEKVALADWINRKLASDADAEPYLPIDVATSEIFSKLEDGVLTCKMIKQSAPEAMDERAINKENLDIYTKRENHVLALNSAASIGCNIVNIGPQDLANGTPHLVLGLLWQIVYEGLMRKVTVENVPGLIRVLKKGEDVTDLLSLSPEELLIRWVNYHMEQAGVSRRITNFGFDIADSEAYGVLLLGIAPADTGVDQINLSLNPMKRAEAVMKNADKMDCKAFVTPKDVVDGNQKLNTAFVANLFSTHPALAPLPDQPDLADIGETREERTFRNFMNSLGVSPPIHRLYSDLRDGLILLQVMDLIKPGIVQWDRVNRGHSLLVPSGAKRKIENCNYFIELCKSVKFSVVGIGGAHIYQGKKTLTLAVVWQLMRAYVSRLLEQMSLEKDSELVAAVNDKLQNAGKPGRIASFHDPGIADGRVVLELVDSIHPGIVNWDLVNPGSSAEKKLNNARYAVSMARKIGARVYAQPEDIVEVKPKMIWTLFASFVAI